MQIYFIPRIIDRIPLFISKGNAGTMAAVSEAAERIAERAATHSRVRTGAMQSGWSWQSLGEMEAEVFNQEEYAIHHEFGTIYMTAQPMLAPAVEETREEFEDMVQVSWTPSSTRTSRGMGGGI